MVAMFLMQFTINCEVSHAGSFESKKQSNARDCREQSLFEPKPA
jgi:hypothetical protein